MQQQWKKWKAKFKFLVTFISGHKIFFYFFGGLKDRYQKIIANNIYISSLTILGLEPAIRSLSEHPERA